MEQVARDHAAGRFVGLCTDEYSALVARLGGAFGQQAADVVGLLVVAPSQALPHLLLTGMVVCDRETHELLKAHRVLGVEVEQLRADRDELEALAHDSRRDEEPCCNLLVSQPVFVPERLEGPELIERVQGFPHRVLGQAVLLGDAVRLHEAGHGGSLGQPLLLDQELERLKAPPAGRHLERARLLTLSVPHGPHAQGLQQAAPGNVLGQFLDAHAGLDAAHVGLAQHQLVQGDVARRAQHDLGHEVLRDGRA